MEMRKKPSKPKPSPFSASAERVELERALLSLTTASAASSGAPLSQHFVPTAVPILAGDYAFFDANANCSAPVVAYATATMAPPPPPPLPGSASRTVASVWWADVNHARTAPTKKSDFSYDDDVVRPEPPPPTAHALPTNSLPPSRRTSTSAQLRAVNVAGAIGSGEEMVGVARAQRRGLD